MERGQIRTLKFPPLSCTLNNLLELIMSFWFASVKGEGLISNTAASLKGAATSVLALGCSVASEAIRICFPMTRRYSTDTMVTFFFARKLL